MHFRNHDFSRLLCSFHLLCYRSPCRSSASVPTPGKPQPLKRVGDAAIRGRLKRQRLDLVFALDMWALEEQLAGTALADPLEWVLDAHAEGGRTGGGYIASAHLQVSFLGAETRINEKCDSIFPSLGTSATGTLSITH